LSFNLTYSLGNKIRLLQLASGYGSISPNPSANLRAELVNRWRQQGDEAYTNIPGLKINSTYENQAWFLSKTYAFAGDYYSMYDNSNIRVVSGNYLKLQALSFRYSFEKALCEKIGLKAAYISVNGSNLFTIASPKLKGQDPTQSGSSPSISQALYPVYTMNLGINF
jgi:hypothetical protein